MTEIELIPEGISENDNTTNVEMSDDEIWFLKRFIKMYNPKKIVEIGISAGGNTVNLLRWKDKDAKLFSVDISTHWYLDNSKLSGWMADELDAKNNWKIYRGYDYLDVYKEIGDDIDLMIIDTVHFMPGEFLSFLVALPQLKDGSIVILHDIHLNMIRLSGREFGENDCLAYCTGLLFGSVSSNQKWSLKTDTLSNIGAFVIDETTRQNIKDFFHVLSSSWRYFPFDLNLFGYLEYVRENYSFDCYNLFKNSLKIQSKYFTTKFIQNAQTAQTVRVDIKNYNNENNTIEVITASNSVDIDFPNWFKTDEGTGAVIQTQENSFDLELKCINEGLLKIVLRGPDIRDEFGNRIPYFVDFNSFIVNTVEIIEDNHKSVCHDCPYAYNKIVHDGEIIRIHAEWVLYAP